MSSNIELEKKILDLLEVLICPKTGGELIFDKKKMELVSKKASLAYPILEGIPIMLEEKARKIK
tara:strand:+ start:240 stop:431 length:192 start_codon:yes stop_codon:yes gene_type:complete